MNGVNGNGPDGGLNELEGNGPDGRLNEVEGDGPDCKLGNGMDGGLKEVGNDDSPAVLIRGSEPQWAYVALAFNGINSCMAA